MFDARSIMRGRTLVLTGTVNVALEGDSITGTVQAPAGTYRVRITPSLMGRRVTFDSRCSCGAPGCPHLAAAAFAALDRMPALRRAEQQTFLDTLVEPGAKPAPRPAEKPAEAPRPRTVFELSPGEGANACMVTLLRVDSAGKATPVTPRIVAADLDDESACRDLARLLGGGGDSRVGIASTRVTDVLPWLVRSGKARWQGSGKRLVSGEVRMFAQASAATLPPNSGVIMSAAGPWYVDASSGAVGRVRILPTTLKQRGEGRTKPVLTARAKPEPQRRRIDNAPVTEQMIVECEMVPALRLTRFPCPDDNGRMVDTDALVLDFDYDGTLIPPDDERQFVRVDGPSGPSFVRRNRPSEARVLETLRLDGFVQMRMAQAKVARGRLVFVFRGREAAENWQRFISERLPALQQADWRSTVEPNFGPRVVDRVGPMDLRVADAAQGGFSLDFGVQIDGVRHDLMPILMRLRERGGMAAARVVDGELISSLDDGRIFKLDADRMARLLAVVDDMLDSARRGTGDELVLEVSEAPAMLDLEEIVETRWQDGAAIAAHLERFRGVEEIPQAPLPASFKGTLRPYQQEGVNWLQHLRAHDLGGFLADDMGLGKTAQTIAHLAIEHANGRLDRPALVVVPTSLVPNWSAELARFAPHLKVVVLHGLERHEKRGDLDGVHVVITTYTVLSRDIEEMVELAWHMVVLDEAQSIKSPTAKATHAVCRLETRHRLCLSGTPIENNLDELWSQFAFLMPGLLGHRKSFAKRFRGPIEKEGDPVRRRQLASRIRPFILRRTKSAVATELPPKHTILRRITLAPEQRELYETIRATLHEKVTQEIAATSLARSQVVVLDALLKLRQVCCDPRLVKLPSARLVDTSSKLDDMMEMISEMIAEGRRILLFSQFTSMLDLMKPSLQEAGIAFVELRGDTRDRAEPVRSFEAGEVPLFLISLKAGGRGLNLTSADTVIHYDPWWNPAVEEQASDRAHRIGQTKSVFVYKLIAADTVEERILELQERKAALANIAFSDEGPIQPAMAGDDIEFLFGPPQDKLAA